MDFISNFLWKLQMMSSSFKDKISSICIDFFTEGQCLHYLAFQYFMTAILRNNFRYFNIRLPNIDCCLFLALLHHKIYNIDKKDMKNYISPSHSDLSPHKLAVFNVIITCEYFERILNEYIQTAVSFCTDLPDVLAYMITVLQGSKWKTNLYFWFACT